MRLTSVKKHIKKLLHSPITWGILIFFLFVLLLALLYAAGFRITYAPSLDNNWNAVAACATWAGVIASTGAIFVAICIPKIIADQQNRIALFDKQFNLYITLCRCISFAEVIEKTNSREEMRLYFVTTLADERIIDSSTNAINRDITPLLYKTIFTMSQGTFLFTYETEDWLRPLIDSIVTLLSTNETDPEFEYNYDAVKKYAEDAKQLLLPKIENSLTLTNKMSD